jgi:hypothetical protein
VTFCTKCGNSIDLGDRFCAKCGAPTAAAGAKSGQPTVDTAAEQPPTVDSSEPTEDEPLPRKRHRVAASIVVVVLAIIACALVFGVGYLRSHSNVTAVLGVHVLPTEQGISDATPPSYPSTVTVRVPRSWEQDLAAYGVAGVVLLAPKGWVEKSALIAADGGTGATLEASKSAAIPGQFAYETSGGGWGNTWSDAAPYFPWVRQDWKKSNLGFSCPGRPAGLVEQFKGTQQADYSLSRGAEARKGLRVTGVAQTSLTPSNPSAEGGFDGLEVALPLKDRGLAKVMLDYFVAEQARMRSTPAPAASDTAEAAPTPSESGDNQDGSTLPGIGGTQTFYDSSNPNFDLSVTMATADTETAQGGGYLYGVELTIENLGKYSYTDNIEDDAQSSDGRVLLYQTGGSTSDVTWTHVTGTHPLEQVHILPGESVTGWVYFFSNDPINAESFSFQPKDTVNDMTYDPGEWQLS